MQGKSFHLFLEQCLGEPKQKQRMELISFPSASPHDVESALRHLWFCFYHQDLWQSSKVILVCPFFPSFFVSYFQLFIFYLALRCLNERDNLN